MLMQEYRKVLKEEKIRKIPGNSTVLQRNVELPGIFLIISSFSTFLYSCINICMLLEP